MKKFLKIVLVIAIIALNAVAILPGQLSNSAEEGQCSITQLPKIQLTEVNPIILPNLLKL
jgi:hypothetical protein